MSMMVQSGRFGSASSPSDFATISPNWCSFDTIVSGDGKNATTPASNGFRVFGPCVGALTGKFYYEVTVLAFGTTNAEIICGVGTWEASLRNYLGNADNRSIGYTWDNRILYSDADASGGPGAYGVGDVIGVAVDCDARSVRFRKNGGAWSAPQTNNLGAQPLMPLTQIYYNGASVDVNYGNDPWHTAPDSGYVGWPAVEEVAARYWRLQIQKVGITAGLAHVAEWELREALGGADVIGGGTISADQYHDSSYVPANAIDNNASTFWSTTWNSTPPHWLKYDFGDGNDKIIRQTTVQPRGDTDQGQPIDIRLLYSNDNAAFYPASGQGRFVWTPGDIKTFNCF